LIAEVDGIQHLDQQQEDAERTLFLTDHGFQVIRIWNAEIIHDLDSVCKKILSAVPLPEGEGGGAAGEAQDLD